MRTSNWEIYSNIFRYKLLIPTFEASVFEQPAPHPDDCGARDVWKDFEQCSSTVVFASDQVLVSIIPFYMKMITQFHENGLALHLGALNRRDATGFVEMVYCLFIGFPVETKTVINSIRHPLVLQVAASVLLCSVLWSLRREQRHEETPSHYRALT